MIRRAAPMAARTPTTITNLTANRSMASPVRCMGHDSPKSGEYNRRRARVFTPRGMTPQSSVFRMRSLNWIKLSAAAGSIPGPMVGVHRVRVGCHVSPLVLGVWSSSELGGPGLVKWFRALSVELMLVAPVEPLPQSLPRDHAVLVLSLQSLSSLGNLRRLAGKLV